MQLWLNLKLSLCASKRAVMQLKLWMKSKHTTSYSAGHQTQNNSGFTMVKCQICPINPSDAFATQKHVC